MTAPIFKNGEWLLPDDHEAQERERDRKGLGGSNFAGNKAKFEREFRTLFAQIVSADLLFIENL